jgi:hypothetical protein
MIAVLATFHDLLRKQQPALIRLSELLEPVQSARRNSPPNGYGNIDRHPAPACLIEEYDDLCVARLHPIRQRARIHSPAADEVHARIDGTIRVVIAAAAGAVGTWAPRKDRRTVHLDLQPAVTARGARLTSTLFRSFSQALKNVCGEVDRPDAGIKSRATQRDSSASSGRSSLANRA